MHKLAFYRQRDARNRRVVATDPLGFITRWTYDAAGNNLTEKRPDDGVTTRTFDAMNRVASIVDAKGQMTRLTYEAGAGGGNCGCPGGSGPRNLGEWTSLTDARGQTYARIFDARNLLTQMTYPDGSQERYTYDTVGNALTYTTRAGQVRTSTFDVRNRETNTTWSDATPAITRAFDAAGRVLSENNGIASLAYTYDAANQLLSETTAVTGQPSRTVGYAYDATGNRQSVSNNGTIQPYTANALNQYTSAAGSTPTYDANGNLASASGAAYTYDAQNRLVSATVNGTTTTMSYDARNRVVRRTTGGADLFFTYADWNLLEERNAAGAIQQAYVHGAQIDELLVKITPAGAVYYHADALGSTLALTNETGQFAETYTYDAFGAATARSPSGSPLAQSALGNRFLFTGRELIGATGIYDYRNRVYSPVLGRFLQTDPIRFSAGDVNLYRYASNSPVSLIDPLGLFTPKRSNYNCDEDYENAVSAWKLHDRFDAWGKVPVEDIEALIERK